MDIVDRLRRTTLSSNPQDYIEAPLEEAADEIVHLRAELAAAKSNIEAASRALYQTVYIRRMVVGGEVAE